MFNNSLPVSSLFCKISLLCLPHCHPARIPCTFCSSIFCTLCAHSSSMHHLSSVPFSCCTPPSSLHMHPSQQQQQPISSLLHILILPVHLVHVLYLIILHSLHVECSACSSWKLFSFSVCSCHLSIITGCHNQIPSPHHQLRFLHLLLQLSSTILLQLQAPTLIQLSIASKQSLFYWQIPRDSSPSLSITSKCLRVL
jgi:hypothetical protein